MRQVDYGTGGGVDSLSIVTGEKPVPGPGELLLEVHYAGVNGPDLVQRQGKYPPPPGASPVLGLEAAGRVAAVGEGVSEWAVGDMVTALTPGGAYAEYCVVPAGHALPIPPGMSVADAAGLPEVWFTAWANLVSMGHLNTGDHVLIHGGAGGVGSAAIQLARHLGARVFTTEGSDAKLEYCRRLGAHAVIDYRSTDFAEAIKAEIGKRGLDVVLDIIGGPYLQKNVNLLTRGGRLLILAFNQGSKVELDLMAVLVRRLTIAGSTLRARSDAEKTAIRDDLLHHLWPAFALDELKTHTFATFPLEEVGKAHQLMEDSGHYGKIVLQLR